MGGERSVAGGEEEGEAIADEGDGEEGGAGGKGAIWERSA